MDVVQEQLNPWLGAPKRKQSEERVTLTYRMESEEGIPLRLKIEINSREHFSVLGYVRQIFAVKSRWFTGTAAIPTYQLDELLGTKLRALFQRKKGRDLFDLWTAFTTTDARPERVVACFMRYLEHEGNSIYRAEFERNLLEKLNDPRFTEDIDPLLTDGSSWDPYSAVEFVMNDLISLLPGESWRGRER
jgi:predicted nucleotidyltransferase component of viral defense system